VRKHWIEPHLNSPPTVDTLAGYEKYLADFEQECHRALSNARTEQQREIYRAAIPVVGELRSLLNSEHLGLIDEYQKQQKRFRELNRSARPALRAREDLDIGRLIQVLDGLFRREFKLTGLMRSLVGVFEEDHQQKVRTEHGKTNQDKSREKFRNTRADCIADMKDRRDKSLLKISDRQLYREMATKYKRTARRIADWDNGRE
jgi:hypothetical protein